MDSLPISDLDARSVSFVLNLCLSAADVRAVVGGPCGPTCGHVSNAVWQRNRLHAACCEATPLARRVTDLLDLRHVDALHAIRHAPCALVAGIVRDAVANDRRATWPGLLWAVATDPRPAVRSQAHPLMCECFLRGCELLRETA